MYVCVCVCVSMCVCAKYVCNVCFHLLSKPIHILTYTCMRRYIRRSTLWCSVCVCVCMYVCWCMCVLVYVQCTCTHTACTTRSVTWHMRYFSCQSLHTCARHVCEGPASSLCMHTHIHISCCQTCPRSLNPTTAFCC